MKLSQLLFFLFSLSIIFNNYSQETDEDLEKMLNEDFSKTAQYIDPETGILSRPHQLGTDRSRISFLYHINPNPYEMTKISGFEFIYGHHLNEIWIEGFYLRTNAEFGKIADNNPHDGASSDELEVSSDTLDILGVGASIRGSWIQDIVSSDRIYTQSGAAIGRYSLAQSLRGQAYSGLGLKTDFGLHVRSSKTMHYGIKMSYHLAHVRRPMAFDGEPSKERSLLLSWLTIGVDLTFYF